MSEKNNPESTWRLRIKQGMGKDALDALKERFNYNAPAFIFDQTSGSGVAPNQDYEMVVLNAAIRDGQREVLMYLDSILNHD